MPNSAPSEAKTRQSFFVVLVVFLAALSFTASIYLAVFARKTIDAQIQSNFSEKTDHIKLEMLDRFHGYDLLITATRGLFLSSDKVSAKGLQTYIQNLSVNEQFPGVSSIGYVERVNEADKQAFLKEMHAEAGASPSAFAQFAIHPENTNDPHFIIKYIEPLEGRTASLGFDYTSDPIRNGYLQNAIKSGKSTLTAKVIGISTQKPSIVLLVPHFPLTKQIAPEERESSVKGFTAVGLQTEEFFSSLFVNRKESEGIYVTIYDGEDTTAQNILYEHAPPPEIKNPIKKTEKIEIANHVWTMTFQASPTLGLSSTTEYIPWYIVGAGFVFIAFLLLVFYLLLSSQNRAEKLAEKITANLRQSEEEYRAIFDSLQDVLYRTDLAGKITMVTPSISQYLGVPAEQVVGMSALDFYADPNERDMMTEAMKKNGKVNDYLIKLKAKNNQIIDVSLNAHFLLNDQQQPVGVEGVLRDVSNRRKVEHELEKRTEELEALNKIMTGRELKMLELKQELDEKKRMLGET